MATGRVNVGGSGGGLNVYAQLNEPKTKEGIWMKTDTKITQIINDLKLWFSGRWVDPTLIAYADYPAIFSPTGGDSIGSIGYTFGGHKGTLFTRLSYAYDSINDVFSAIAALPSNRSYAAIARQGTDFYISGGRLSNGSFGTNDFIKYDTITNTYTVLTSSLGLRYSHGISAVGRKVYLFGGMSNTATASVSTSFAYDIDTDSWESIQNTPLPGVSIAWREYGIASVGTKIYLIGGSVRGSGGSGLSTNAIYCYDVEVDQWEQRSSAPQHLPNPSVTVVGSDIYCFSDAGYYRYDTIGDTWTIIDPAPSPTTKIGFSAQFIEGGIYALGGGDDLSTYVYTLDSKDYPEGTVIIFRRSESIGEYKTELCTPKDGIGGVLGRLLSYFDDAFIYEDGELQYNPITYYGDGIKWVQYKGF